MPAADPTTLLGRWLSGRQDGPPPFGARGLERQARALLSKRYHEIRKLLPLTCARINDGDAVFESYARGFWPEGHDRHWQDALEFCRYLSRARPGAVLGSERAAVEFRLSRRRFMIRWAGDLWIGNKKRRGLQVFYRDCRNQSRQWAIYLALT